MTLSDLLDILDRNLKENDGSVALFWNVDKYYVTIQYGSEAPDSPMVGGEAIGFGRTVEAALSVAIGETGWK